MRRGAPHRPDGAALLIALGLAALAALIAWQTGRMPAAAGYARIGPTAFPFAIAAGLALLAVGTAVSAFRGGLPERETERVGPMLWIVAGLVAQMLLLRTAGFSIATGALFALVARGFGRGPLWVTFPIGAALSLAIWIVFARGLSLSLPAGPLESLVP